MEQVFEVMAVMVCPARRTWRIHRLKAEADPDDRSRAFEAATGVIGGHDGHVARKVESAGTNDGPCSLQGVWQGYPPEKLPSVFSEETM
jgi:hypothetical protein